MLPDKKCLHILSKLADEGFQAYIIGESVRDIIMQRPIRYFDITTNADITQIMEIFSDEHEFLTNKECGAVIVYGDNASFRITTLKTNDDDFEAAMKEKLAKFNFTMNAIAMNASGNLYDPFGGRFDIDKRVIKCVGDPEICFSKDPLQILRALRFASSLDLNIDLQTSKAAKKLRESLKNVSTDEIRSEFVKILCGINAAEILLEYREIIAVIVPEITDCFNFQQFSRYHKYDVYEHTARAVSNIAINGDNAELLRIAMFFMISESPKCSPMTKKDSGILKVTLRQAQKWLKK